MYVRQFAAAAALISIGLAAQRVPVQPVQLACPSGAITWLSGDGTPRTPLLLWWQGRPVGGGSVHADGRWSLPLSVGNERPGVYPVEVWVRGERTLVGTFQCAVGVIVPTPAAPAPTPAPAAQNFDRNGDSTVTCDDFDTQAEARIALAAGYLNLDTDHDGIPCEGLPQT